MPRPALAGPAEQQIPTATPNPSRYFLVKVAQTPVTATPGLTTALQEVAGTVLDRAGKGIDGLTVRAAWGNSQALTTTRDGGAFRFTVAPGEYRIRLIGMASDEATFAVGGAIRTAIEFREGDRPAPAAPTTTGPGGTPAAASAATATATSSPTATPTATRTVVPSVTPAPSTTPTPNPQIPGVGTPVSISVVSVQRPTPTVAPSLRPLDLPLSLPTELDLDVETWGRTFLAGVGIGAVLAAFGLVVVAIRHF